MNEKHLGYDAYPLEEESDQERSESSDDDLDVILHGTSWQRKRLHKKQQSENKSSSEDEFEKEMKAELNSTMKTIEASCAVSNSKTEISGASGSGFNPKSQYYDNDYFDSDSDEEYSSIDKKNMKRPIDSNEDLLYDPNMDDVDQKWIDRLRSRYQPVAAGPKPLPTSDAILNCPCCMISLCMDCQRHVTYQHQYRAMFVMNCVVRTEQVLRFPIAVEPLSKKKAKQRQADQRQADQRQADNDSQSATASVEETFNPVICSECKTEVGVYDENEIYHFFNVLASHS